MSVFFVHKKLFFLKKLKDNGPGVLIATAVGLMALMLSQHYHAPAMLFSLLLGMALSFLYQGTQCRQGIEFTATHILRIGVALLGFRVVFSDLAILGWQTAALLMLGVVSTILVGLGVAKILGLTKNFGLLTGGAVGICGASAAMAIAAVLPKTKRSERDTLLTIISVTAFSTVAMILYPVVAELLALNSTQTSIFLGGTIHDVAQVVGAGYSVSEQTGDLATITKLVRVAFLLPVVACILLVLKLTLQKQVNAQKLSVPWFLVAFFILMVLNSVVEIPVLVTGLATDMSRFALMVAIASIGMKSNLGQLLTLGFRPILLVFIETVWIASVILLALLYLDPT